jgi:MFS family permease
MATPSLLTPFRVRSFRFQWPADVVTSWAFEMETLILGWYVLVETNSVVFLTVFGALLYGGTLIAPMMGVVSDRIGHRNMLSAMRASYVAVAGGLMVFAFASLLNPVVVCCLAAVSGLVRPSDMGLRGALTADWMPPQYLTAAMSISRTTGDFARIAGALTGAGLFAQFGVGPAYVAITALYAIAAVLTWCAGQVPKLASPQQTAEVTSPWRDLREGLSYVWNTPALLAIVWFAFLFNGTAFAITNGLLPYVAKEIYRVDQQGLGYLVASLACGALLGAIIVSRLGAGTRLPRLMVVTAIAWHCLLLVFAQMQSMTGGVIFLLLVGIFQSITMVCHTVILLHAAGQRFRGRALGVRMMAIYSLPLGLLIAGALVERIGFHATAALYAVTGIVFTVVIAWRWRASLWRADAL